MQGSLYLSDVWPGGSNIIGQAGFAQAGLASFSLGAPQIGVGNYTVPAGHSLQLTITVPNSSADDVWVAYDTTSYKSRIIIP